MQPLMDTDSEELLKRGIETGIDTLPRFFEATGLDLANTDRTICHQVGVAHRNQMLEALGFGQEQDHSTFPFLGNTGSAALPITLAHAAETGFVRSNQNVALLGIGSGINCLMIGVRWIKSQIKSETWSDTKTKASASMAAEV